MFAVIKTGGKQYRVEGGEKIEVARIDAKEGAKVDVDVMMTSDGGDIKMGKDAASVTAKVVDHGRSDKITVFKKKRRQGYRRTKGHRQDYTTIAIEKIG